MPRVCFDRPHQAAGKHRRRRHLPIQNVRARLRDDFLPRLRVQPDADLVSHRSCGHKQRRLAPEDLRRAAFQQVHRRVFAVNVVPTSAAAIAARIATEGLVTVSDRRSIIFCKPVPSDDRNEAPKLRLVCFPDLCALIPDP